MNTPWSRPPAESAKVGDFVMWGFSARAADPRLRKELAFVFLAAARMGARRFSVDRLLER